MSKPLSILISGEPYEPTLAQLREQFPNTAVHVMPPLEAGQILPIEFAQEVEILFTGRLPANFNDLTALKWIQLASAGYSEVFGLPIVERGIRVTNALGVFDIPVAEWNLMMILNCHRHLSEMVENQRQHIWDRAARFQAELRGAVLGLYGYGGIARETARLAKAFGMTIWVLTRAGTIKPRNLKYRVEGTGDPEGTLPDRVFGADQIEEFLGGVDVLSIGIPLTLATRGLLGEKELRLLKPTAVLVNAARAAIIEQDPFVRAVQEGWFRSAALDAHYEEPLPANHPLWSAPDFLLTPHISGSDKSTHFLDRVYDVFYQNVLRYATGQPLLNELTPAQLAGE